MHLLVVTVQFPWPDNPYPGNFIGQQVLTLAERVERITVVNPVPTMPAFLTRLQWFANRLTVPERYTLVPNRCEVLFPRYLKAPGNMLLSWTLAQWYRIICSTIGELSKTSPVSLIHAQAGNAGGWSSILAARQHKIPCAVTYQGSEVHLTFAQRRKGWKLCGESFRLADLNICVSKSLQDILMAKTCPQGRCEVLLRGVDRTKFFPSWESPKKPIVLFVGRVAVPKGVWDLLAAWQRVADACPSAELWIIGRDYTRGEFIKAVRRSSQHSSVKITGPLPPPDVARLMRTAQVLCLPSHGEGTPNCVMEALACGLPVVATRVGGIPDIVSHGTTGLLVEKSDIPGLAEAIITLLLDPSACIRMGKEAHAFAITHLDIRKTAERLIQLYRDTIYAHATSLDKRDAFDARRNSKQNSSGI